MAEPYDEPEINKRKSSELLDPSQSMYLTIIFLKPNGLKLTTVNKTKSRKVNSQQWNCRPEVVVVTKAGGFMNNKIILHFFHGINVQFNKNKSGFRVSLL